MPRFASFGRSFLLCVGGAVPSGSRRPAVALAAARRRWPRGRVVRCGIGRRDWRFMVPGVDARDGSPCWFCALLFQAG